MNTGDELPPNYLPSYWPLSTYSTSNTTFDQLQQTCKSLIGQLNGLKTYVRTETSRYHQNQFKKVIEYADFISEAVQELKDFRRHSY